MDYWFDADSSRAYWVSEFLESDEWNSQFFKNGVREPLTEIYPHAERPRLKNPAPIISLASPKMEILSDTVIKNRRYVEIEITTGREAAFCELLFNNHSGLIISSVNGREINPDAYKDWPIDFCELQYHGLSTQPLRLSLNSNIEDPTEIIIIERQIGIREMEGYEPMPDSVIPTTGYNSYQEVVKKTWRF